MRERATRSRSTLTQLSLGCLRRGLLLDGGCLSSREEHASLWRWSRALVLIREDRSCDLRASQGACDCSLASLLFSEAQEVHPRCTSGAGPFVSHSLTCTAALTLSLSLSL